MIDVTDTIPWDDICFIDSETRSNASDDGVTQDITQTTARRYATGAWPIIITWAYGLEGKVKRWENPLIIGPPKVEDLPEELLEWDGYFAAWNSGFDRAILDPYFEVGIRGWLDMMAHAAYNNLPMALDRAAKSCGLEGKKTAGKKLIQLFCSPDGALPEDEPEQWADFCEYADVDVEQMQGVAAATFAVPYAIWEEFWVSEEINDRGLPIDTECAKGGAIVAEAYAAILDRRCAEITDGAVTGIRQYVRQRSWVWDRVRDNPMIAEHMIEARRTLEDGTDEFVLKMDRPRITKMIASLETLNEKEGLTDGEFAVLQLLTEREFGASAAPMKFQKMLDMVMADGRLPGQYVFAGATQTGRYSSRGVQMHNMTRSTVGDVDKEQDLLGCLLRIAEGAAYSDKEAMLDAIEEGFGNVGKALSRVIRPMILAEPDHDIVWGDWSSVEARALPWLAKAEDRLDVFRRIDADPENEPDVYLHAAAGMYHEDAYDLMRRKDEGDKVAKDFRQRGKIAELALGFLGGVGALQSMAANYGMAFEHSEGKDIVDRWRASNKWAMEFGDTCWDAFVSAAQNPGEVYEAGRLQYTGIDMNGQVWVICLLPDGRPLFYRDVRERVDVTYDPFEPGKVIEKSYKLSFEGEKGIKFLWPGILVENATQAICASLLRCTQVALEKPGYDFFEQIGHTHDEIVLHTRSNWAKDAGTVLHRTMTRDIDWAEGFPLGADITYHSWYTKTLDD